MKYMNLASYDLELISEKFSNKLIVSFQAGFNFSVLTYGQSGSGKTHTLFSDGGLIKSFVAMIFRDDQDNMRHNNLNIRKDSRSPNKLSKKDLITEMNFNNSHAMSSLNFVIYLTCYEI